MILLVDLDDEPAAVLAGAAPGDDVERVPGPEAVARAHARQPEAVVISPDIENPVALTQQVHAGCNAAVLLLAHPDRLQALRRAVLFAPFLGSDVSCWSAAQLSLAGAEMAEAAERTRRGRQNAHVLAAARARLNRTPREPRAARYLGHLLGHLPVGVVALDERARVLAVNEYARAWFGVDERAAFGASLDTLLPEPAAMDLRRLIAGGEAGPLQIALADESGGRRAIEASVSRYSGPEEEPRVLVAFLDVTERVRTAAERDRALERLRQVQSVTDAALLRLGLDELLEALLPRLSAMLRLDTAVVLLGDSAGALEVRAAIGLDERLASATIEGFSKSLVGRVARTGELLRFDSRSSRERLHPAFAPVGSVVGIPLRHGDELLGVLRIGKREPGAFSDEDETVLRLVADRAAIAISQSRRYEREHDIATTLQRSLLPERLPDRPEVALAAQYLPAATSSDVGGDWYDAVELVDGRVCLVIGDVAGRGIEAASITGSLRNALRAYLLEGHPPGRAVALLNELCFRLHRGAMATVCVVVVAADGRALTAVAAGHPPPLVWQPDGEPEILWAAHGAVIGAVPRLDYAEASVPMAPGAVVVLYTDGLVERRGEPLDDGLDRLARSLRSGPADPQALTQHLVGELLAERQGGDDVAILIGRTRAPADGIAQATARR